MSTYKLKNEASKCKWINVNNSFEREYDGILIGERRISANG